MKNKTEERKEFNNEAIEKREIETDDVAQHYINLKNMYKTVYDEITGVSTNVNNANDINIQNEFEDTDSNYDKYEYYDEYYNIYDSDYCTEYDDYSDAYSDDYDYKDN